MNNEVMLCINNRYMRYLIKEMLSYKNQGCIEVFVPDDYNEAINTLKKCSINVVFLDEYELIDYHEVKFLSPKTAVVKLISSNSECKAHKGGDRFLLKPFTYEELMGLFLDSDDFTPISSVNQICYDLLIRSVEFCKSSVIAFEKNEEAVYVCTCLEKKLVYRDFDDLEKALQGLFFRTSDNKLINISMVKAIKKRKDYYEVILKNSDIKGMIEMTKINELVKKFYI